MALKLSKNKRKIVLGIVKLMNENNIICLPIKIHEKQEYHVDLVVIKNKDLKKAESVLLNQGYVKPFCTAIFWEIKKKFFKKGKIMIHLHKAISWNGVDYLNKENVWRRRINLKGIPYTSKEDEYLILIAHSLFENKLITKDDFERLESLKSKNLNFNIINSLAKKNNWYHGLRYFINHWPDNPYVPFKYFGLFGVTFKKFIMDLRKLRPISSLWQLFSYTVIDYVICYRLAKKRYRKYRGG